MTHRLTNDEKDRYREAGYLVRPLVFDADELERIAATCEALVDNLTRRREARRQTFGSYVFDVDDARDVVIKWEGDSDVVHGIEPFAHLSKDLERLAYDPRFIEPMIDILEVEAPMLFTEKLNLKRPVHGGPNPLHRDHPYWVPVAENASEVATAMLFLDDAGLANGCLQVAPGSHRQASWQKRRDSDPFGANEIDEESHPDLQLVAVEVPAGSLVTFGPMLVHRSMPNTSQTERRALLYSYQPPGRRTQLDVLRARLHEPPRPK